MKLSISNIAWTAKDDIAVYELMNKYGYSGVEIAPTRILTEKPYEQNDAAREWSNKLKEEYGFAIPSMQSIWYGRTENIFNSVEERKALLDYTKMAIDFAETIGCKNLVFGCPRNRNLSENSDSSIAVEFFRELGDYALEHNTVIGMEANPPIYNTNFINDTKSAIELIKEVNSEGFKLNLDIGTMVQNEESIEELVGNVSLINHVHISEPGLKLIENRELHNKLKEVLVNENYQGFVSIEMGSRENLDEIESILAYVKSVFE